MGKFEIDDKGFKTQMSEVPLWRLIQEIISNSFDEKAVTKIDCEIKYDKLDNVFMVEIKDDGNGFKNIKDIFTLYGDSYKRTNPEQSGRYNEGEKRFLAVAQKGFVITKNTRIDFDDYGRKDSHVSNTKGTVVSALFKRKDFEEESLEDIIRNIHRVAVPDGKELWVNDDFIEPKQLVKKFKAELFTVKASGPNSKLVQIKRETWVYLYKKIDEKPIIYERGIPVQELEESLQWHVDIRQKIPQTTDRNVVSDKYLHKLYSIITENTLDLITDNQSDSNWINDGLKFQKKPEVIKAVMRKKYGTDQVMIRSTTDSEANERAESNGVHLISGSELDPLVRENLKSLEVLKFAGQEYVTDHFETAKTVEPNEDMELFTKVVKAVARDTIHKDIKVEYVTTSRTNELAQYGQRTMTWNVKVCGGKKAFDILNPTMIGILIHELAHDKFGNHEGFAHLSHDYLHEMERIAGIVGSKGIDFWIDLV